MKDTSAADRLLERVRFRLDLRSFARTASIIGLVLAGAGTAVVLIVRLLGLLAPDQENLWWLVGLIPATLLIAWLLHRRAGTAAAARAVDAHARTKDLFLTLTTLSTSAGAYQPLVEQAAERRSAEVDPVRVVPFHPWPAVKKLFLAGTVLAVTAALTPRLDPFGHVEAVQQAERQQEELQAVRRSARQRREQLKKKTRALEEAERELESRVAELKQDYRRMQPKQAQANARILTRHRSALSEQWKARSSESLRQMMNRPLSGQQMGSSRSQKMKQWLKELQEGRADSLQKELQNVRSTMQALMEASDPEERRKLAGRLRRQIQDLKKFASDQAASKELTSALRSALKALETVRPGRDESSETMTPEAMQALKESLELAQAELEQLARSAKDLKRIEDALRTIQMAQRLNTAGQLDGEKLEGCETLADYAEMYAQMMGDGFGGGGNQGSGGGKLAEYDDAGPEGYKDEKSRTHLKAGKILLSIRTKEYADDSELDPDTLREYQAGVESLQAGVQSAIEAEDIPPGYVDGIKSYSDSLEKIDGNPAATE